MDDRKKSIVNDMEQSYIISNLTIQLLCSNIFIMQTPMGVVFVVNFEGTNQISLAHVCFLSKSANQSYVQIVTRKQKILKAILS